MRVEARGEVYGGRSSPPGIIPSDRVQVVAPAERPVKSARVTPPDPPRWQPLHAAIDVSEAHQLLIGGAQETPHPS